MEEAFDKLVPVAFVVRFVNPVSQRSKSIDIDGVNILEEQS
jgi:hypothetical protein